MDRDWRIAVGAREERRESSYLVSELRSDVGKKCGLVENDRRSGPNGGPALRYELLLFLAQELQGKLLNSLGLSYNWLCLVILFSESGSTGEKGHVRAPRPDGHGSVRWLAAKAVVLTVRPQQSAW